MFSPSYGTRCVRGSMCSVIVYLYSHRLCMFSHSLHIQLLFARGQSSFICSVNVYVFSYLHVVSHPVHVQSLYVFSYYLNEVSHRLHVQSLFTRQSLFARVQSWFVCSVIICLYSVIVCVKLHSKKRVSIYIFKVCYNYEKDIFYVCSNFSV